MSTAGQVLPWLPPPTEETDKCHAFNHGLLAFPKVREPETLVSLPKRKVEVEKITSCHLQ